MSYTTISIEGGLFPPDLLERISLGDGGIKGQATGDFGLPPSRRLLDEMQRSFSDARKYWDAFSRRLERSRESRTTLTREVWMAGLFELLGFLPLEYQRAAVEAGGASFPISHRTHSAENAPPIHIVAVDQPLDERGPARRSPHALVQDFLNRSEALWGVVTNGAKLRLLRDNARLSKPTYLEFDIQAMIEGNAYSEFVVLYRLLHATRFPSNGVEPHECLLEGYYTQGIEEGGRVREKLRDGVKSALEVLGTALVEHPRNDVLRDTLRSGRLDEASYYRQLLNFVYRMLFLMVTEERKLLSTGTNHERQTIYDRYYSITRLRDRAERYFAGDGHGDLWEGLAQTFRLFRDETAAQRLGLSPLNGELFRSSACRDIESVFCPNKSFLAAMRHLSTFDDNGVRRRVNYAHLDVEEFGSVYESLLDYRPVVQLGDASIVPHRFELAAGTERKQTGSYYTPPELVRELIDSALVPVIEDRLTAATTPESKEGALLALRVCDPASGSGHFLLAAARRIAHELAKVRTGEEQPSLVQYRAAIRDVVRNCIYAVDKNPLAVDLCKVALWIEGHAAGLPLGFLDHHIKCGDSLVGVSDPSVLTNGIPDDAYKTVTGDEKEAAKLYRQRNKQERTGQRSMVIETPQAISVKLGEDFAVFGALDERSPTDVQAKEELYQQLRGSGTRWWDVKTACDLWTYAFFAPLRTAGPDGLDHVPTTDNVRNALQGRNTRPQLNGEANAASQVHSFFHWPLEFPDVFERGGFDVVLGNPPFLGGRKITENYGSKYSRFLLSKFSQTSGGADLCAFFVRTAFHISAQFGHLGMVASNTIAQGDTRETGLRNIAQNGGNISFAHRFVAWPGVANVEVNLVALRKGQLTGQRLLDSQHVDFISSRLDSEAEIEAVRLPANSNMSFQGSIVLGSGFLLEPEIAQRLIAESSRNRNVLSPYLTGQDINSRIDQSPSRYVINFGERLEQESRSYGAIWEIVERDVLPERLQKDSQKYPRMVLEWWKFWNNRQNLYKAVSAMERVLVRSRVSELHMLAFAPTDIVFSDVVVVFAFDDYYNFTLLQSNIHEAWIRRNASTMRTDIRYTPTDCFDTFAFPSSPVTEYIESAKGIGRTYTEYRHEIMMDRDFGLTKTYNLYHDSRCQDQDIKQLRSIHADMDRAALDCYGWRDMDLGHGFYKTARGQTRFTLSPQAYQQVLHRLLVLNSEQSTTSPHRGLRPFRKKVE